ncbi:LysM peptidoglycan-binding domain-containing protein [Halobacillus mangrovi]|uniref:LysM peptidoglycan-binding domain-containing protein n=1 Tax=Halobacillus mangrovi TaxID=402384 RepID=UPI003D988D55
MLNTVRTGDTLSSIARKYGTTVQMLADTNQISDPGLILSRGKIGHTDLNRHNLSNSV